MEIKNIVIEVKNAFDGLEEGTKEVFEVIMAENFSKLMTDTKSQIQKAPRTPNMINSKSTLTHIIFKLLRVILDFFS